MKAYSFYIFILIISFYSCHQNNIETSLQEYVDRFFEEGELRGIQLSKKKLDVVFNDDLSSCGVGYSDYEEKGMRRVEINMSSFCWENSNDLQKELVVFHELGHAILERGHKNQRLPNNMIASIMSAEDILNGSYSKYSLELRDYYINELFNPSEPVPNWAKLKTNEQVIFAENFENETNNWKFNVFPEDEKDKVEGEIKLNEEGSSKFATISIPDFFDTHILSSWDYQIPTPDLQIGGTLQLNVSVKTENLTKLNSADIQVSMVTHSWDTDPTNASIVIGKQRDIVFNPTDDSKIYSTQIGYYPSSVKLISISLGVYGQIKGSVQFDDVELIYLD